MVAPEMQITSEPSVTGYLNFMQEAINSGVGEAREIKPNYIKEMALSTDPNALVDRLDLLLLNGSMSARLRASIVNAVNGVALPTTAQGNAAQLATAKANRVKLAIFLIMASSEYLIQR
jgi:hypothetical protein